MSIRDYLPRLPISEVCVDNCLETIYGSCPGKLAHWVIKSISDAHPAVKIVSVVACVALTGAAAAAIVDSLDKEESDRSLPPFGQIQDGATKIGNLLLLSTTPRFDKEKQERESESDSETSIGDGSPPRSVDSSPETPRRLDGTKEQNIEKLREFYDNLKSKEVNAVEQLRSELGATWIEFGEKILNDFGYDDEVMRIVGIFTNIRNNWMRFDFSPLDNSLVGSRNAQKIPDDQNCLFHAIALSYKQVTGKSLQDDTATPHVNLRAQCKKYLSDHCNDPLTKTVLEHALEDERGKQIESTKNDILCYGFLLKEDPYNADKKYALERANTTLQNLQDEPNGLIEDHIEEVGKLGRMGGIAETYAAAHHLKVPIVLCNIAPGCLEKKYVYGAEYLQSNTEETSNNILVIEYVSRKSHYNNRKLAPQVRQELFNHAERMDPAVDTSSGSSSPEHVSSESSGGESDD